MTDGAKAYRFLKIMNRILLLLIVIFLTIQLRGQGDYNPYVSTASINPEPLMPVGSNGTGILSFVMGNTGSDPLEVFPANTIILIITLSNGVPDNNNAVNAIGGSYANLFSWTYNSGVFIGTQTETVPGEGSGSITIDYRVTVNSTSNNPDNGFRVSLVPALYQVLNNISDDDSAERYTYTAVLRDFGDAPASYGSADHVIDFENYIGSLVDAESSNQPSASANADDSNGEDDEDGVTFPVLIRGTTVNIPVRVTGNAHLNAWVDWNGDGDFMENDEWVERNISAGNETVNLSISIPANAVITEPSFMRIRFGPRTFFNNSEFDGSDTFGEVEDYQITILCAPPSAPVIGTVTQPTCTVPTGGVILNGLPSPGSWTLIRQPNDVTIIGTGTSVAVNGLQPGSYSFTVRSADGCTSTTSGNVVINDQPPSPSAPVVGTVTHPTCVLATGSVALSGLPSGSWTINPGSRTGSSTSTVISGLATGEYNFTVTNSAGCTSPASSDIVINNRPPSPSSPVHTLNCTLGSDNSTLTVTSPLGTGMEYRLDNGAFQSSTTFVAVQDGSHTITARNSDGCSTTGSSFNIIIPSAPGIGNITHPTCQTATGSVVLNTLPSAGTWTITRNPGNIINTGSGTSTTISGLSPGTYTFSVATALGCTSVTSGNVVINTPPEAFPAPVPGTVTHPTCNLSTGSVVLSGLPAGTWTLIRNPGGVTFNGTGATRTVSAIPTGTYNFTVINSSGCSSLISADVIINEQPVTPTAPSVGTRTQPTCTIPTGAVVLNGLPEAGAWTLTRLPGTIQTTGTGVSSSISDLIPGIYNFTVTNSAGCVSIASSNVIITAQPPTPTAPVIVNVTQPTCVTPSGTVQMSGLPSSGTWTITRLPDMVTRTGTGQTASVPSLMVGTYNFTVTNSFGCLSPVSANAVVQPNPLAPVLTITNPDPVCQPATVNLTLPSVTAGSTSGLIYSYWRNPGGTLPYNSPATASTGTYYIKVTDVNLCTEIKPVSVVVLENPTANAGPDQTLEYQFNTDITAAEPRTGETGTWSIFEGSGTFINSSFPITSVNNLSVGRNVLLWTVTNNVCRASVDSVVVMVRDLIVPTLITPNNDGRNEFLIVGGVGSLGRAELVIFDRRGVRVYINDNYDNTWNGIDDNGDPLPDDTYFYVIDPGNGRTKTGFIVLRR